MLIPNVCELDELPFLKKPRFKWNKQQEQGQKSKIHLMENLKNLSYELSELMAKIFMFQTQTKKDTSNLNQIQESRQCQYEQLLLTTQKQILSIEKFYFLLNETLPQQQFSKIVSNIKKFISQCKIFIKDALYSKCQIDFGNKEFLTFAIYIQKQHPNSLNFNQAKFQNQKEHIEKFTLNNKFYIKCSVSNLDFQPFKDVIKLKAKKPCKFIIQNSLVITKLTHLYFQLDHNVLSIKYKDIKKYVSLFDSLFYFIDEEYLKLQVYKNYPLLRSKFYLPIKFNDYITQQRLDGPIFSNSDLDCMYAHFIGYNADTVKILQGNNCEECRSYFEGVQQNLVLTFLRDNLFNPYKSDVFFCPQFNRFKLLVKTPVDKGQEDQQQFQEQKPLFKTQIKYLNYMHLRINLKKIYTKKRNKFNDMLRQEKFNLSFEFWSRRLLIMDPVRGKNCSHYEFTDLRLFYLNKITQTSFKCPICNDIVSDNDIIYLKEVQILLKYLKFKTSKSPQLLTTGQCYVNHLGKKLFLSYKKKNKQDTNIISNQIIEIKHFYHTFIDPYISFNQYSLGIPDKYQQKLRQKYLFGLDRRQNQEIDSDEQFINEDLQEEVSKKQYKQVFQKREQ